MIRLCHHLRLPLSVTALLALTSLARSTAAAEGGWEYQPYRIKAILAIDAPGGLAEELSTELPAYLQRRVDAALAPAWIFDVQLAAGAERAQVFTTIETATDAKPTNIPAEKDKLLLLAVESNPTGFTLAAREYDQYVARWGRPIRRDCRQQSALPEQLFSLAWQAFAPLAQFEVDPSDPLQVTLIAARCIASAQCRCAAVAQARRRFSTNPASYITRRPGPGKWHLVGTLDVHRGYRKQRQEACLRDPQRQPATVRCEATGPRGTTRHRHSR